MSKIALNNKNLTEGVILTKMTKKGFIQVARDIENDKIVVNVDGEIRAFDKLSEVTKLYDSRNWSILENDNFAEYDKAYQEKQIDTEENEANLDQPENEVPLDFTNDVVVEDECTSNNEEVIEIIVEDKTVVCTDGRYVCTSKSQMFIILSDYGISPAEITKRTCSHYSFVFGVLHRQGNAGKDAPNKPKQHAQPTKSELMIQLFEQGKTIKEICVELNAHPSFAHSVISKYKKGL